MFAAFIVIYGLTGGPAVLGAESTSRFDTVEACQTWQTAALKRLSDNLAEQGKTFDRIDTKCVMDFGQTASDVFAMPKPEDNGPTPDATAPPAPVVTPPQ